MTSPLHFEDLLHMARGNAIKGEKKIMKQQQSQSSLKLKKQDPKEKKLSEGVQKFLQQKAQEEKRLAEEKRKQKEKLLELRSRDSKANRRVNSMLKMTKSANKACIADARNSFSDALAQQGDYQQPDEDDYGYVSQSSQEWHKKMLEKYKQIPASKPVRRPPPVNVPISQSLFKSKSGHHQENEYTGDVKSSSDNSSNKSNGTNSNNKPKKRPPPPELNFQALLELANKKSQEPVNFCQPLKPAVQMEKETFEYGRPMTAKEKAAYLQEKAYKEKIQSGNITLPPPAAPVKQTIQQSQSSNITSKSDFKIPSKRKEIQAPVKAANSSPSLREEKPPLIKKPSSTKPPQSPPHRSKPPPPTTTSKSSVPQRSSIPQSTSSKIQKPSNNSRVLPSHDSSSRPTTAAVSNNSRVLQPSSNSSRPSTSNYNKSRTMSPPPNRSRMPLSNNSRVSGGNNGRMQPPHRPKHLPPQKRRQIIDSDEEEEYDSEMDDFIADDEEEGGINYSDMIRALTGYDRNKYKNIDEDDIKESSVHEQWLEEKRSARIGKLEDDEEERKEAEEKRRKMLMKKKMRR